MTHSEEYVDALYGALRRRDVRLTYTELEDSLREAADAQLDSLDKLSRHWQRSADDKALRAALDRWNTAHPDLYVAPPGEPDIVPGSEEDLIRREVPWDATGNGFGHG